LNNKQKMSSREMAVLTEIRHDNVKRTIETLADKNIIQLPQIEDYAIINGLGITTYGKEYLVCKRDSYIIVAQLSPEMTARLVDRWQELEAKQSPALPNYQEALRQLADQLDISSKQQLIIEQQRPAVEFHASITDSSNAQTVEVIAKVLGTGQNRMFAWLRNEGLLKPDNLPYQHFLEMKLFRVIESSYLDKRGKSHTYTQTLVTGKGLEYIQKRFN